MTPEERQEALDALIDAKEEVRKATETRDRHQQSLDALQDITAEERRLTGLRDDAQKRLDKANAKLRFVERAQPEPEAAVAVAPKQQKPPKK